LGLAEVVGCRTDANIAGKAIWGTENEDEFDEMEEWEADAEFFALEDWKGLVEYRKKRVEQYPDDPEFQWKLGEANVLNEEYEKAIEFLNVLHKKYPEDPNIQHSLLDALYAIGLHDSSRVATVYPSEGIRVCR
jgi:thioredoxin-like negative regulator of GroEL